MSIVCAITLVFFISAVVFYLGVYKNKKISLRWASIFSLAILIGSFYSLSQIGELADEDYVWASKLVSFAQNGKLGVPLYNGKFGESTVGTLQFLLSSIIYKFLHLTVEQALILPIFACLLILLYVSFKALSVAYQSIFVPLVFLSVVILSPVFEINFANGFDNVMALTLIIVWISRETNFIQILPIRTFRLLIAVLGPLIRLDLVVLIPIVLLLTYSDLKIFTAHGKINRVWNAFKSLRNEIATVGIFLVGWATYKFWAFQSILPAMYEYKAPTLNLFYILKGSKYVAYSFGFYPTTILIFVTLGFAYSIRQKIIRVDRLTYALLVFSVFEFASAIFSGGDYFGPSFARYEFPVIISLLFYGLIRLSEHSIRQNGSRRTFSLLLILVFALMCSLFPSYPSSRIAYAHSSQIFGRASCDDFAAQATANYLSERKVTHPVIISSEVNGAAFHMRARLVDAIGLVDESVYPLTSPPASKGNVLHKHQVPLSDAELNAGNVVWFYGSAVCQDYDINHLIPSDTPPSDDQFASMATSFPNNYRYKEIAEFFNKGYKPTRISFNYQFNGSIRSGYSLVLIRV
jgi:hypothetical protein